MPGIPYFGFPNFYRKNYYNRYQTNFSNNYYNTSTKNFDNNISSHQKTKKTSLSTNNTNLVESINENSNNRSFDKKNPDNSYFFELFGLKLYFDDILIMSLLYFLYNEGVKDEGLFIALILLLLS